MRHFERKIAYFLIVVFLINLIAVLVMFKPNSLVINAVSSNAGDVKFCLNHPPVFAHSSENRTATEAGFEYYANATDDDNQQLSFYDNTSLFEINISTGFINWTNPAVGNYSFTLFVDDNSGCSNARNAMILNVEILQGSCGDGACSTSEDCASCPSDCGACPSPEAGDTASGGAGGAAASTYACAPNWSCSEWSECMPDNKMYRQCVDSNECSTDEGKPAELVECQQRMFLGNFSESPVVVKELQSGEIWWFIFDGKVYEVMLTDVSGRTADFTTTAGISFQLDEGSHIFLDVNHDGKDDLKVRLNEIESGSKVRATFKILKYEKPVELVPSPVLSECVWYWVLIFAIIIFWLAESIPALRYRKKIKIGRTSIVISRRRVRRGYLFFIVLSIILTLLVFSELLGIRQCHSALKPLFIEFPFLWVLVMVIALAVLVASDVMPRISSYMRGVVRKTSYAINSAANSMLYSVLRAVLRAVRTILRKRADKMKTAKNQRNRGRKR